MQHGHFWGWAGLKRYVVESDCPAQHAGPMHVKVTRNLQRRSEVRAFPKLSPPCAQGERTQQDTRIAMGISIVPSSAHGLPMYGGCVQGKASATLSHPAAFASELSSKDRGQQRRRPCGKLHSSVERGNVAHLALWEWLGSNQRLAAGSADFGPCSVDAIRCLRGWRVWHSLCSRRAFREGCAPAVRHTGRNT